MATCNATPSVAMSDELPSVASPNTSFGGYNCSFVDADQDPAKDLYCLICTRVLREPQLTDCCGNHYCSSCLKKWQESSRACPLCRERDFSTLRDKKTERLVNGLKVKCRNRKSGCTWTGDLGDLELHVKRNCLYVLTECTNGCGSILQRKELPHHMEALCYLRQVQCEHCGLEGAYQFVVDQHYDQCPKVPVSCANSCGGELFPREALSKHEAECPMQPVQCKFQVIGCKTTIARKFLPNHMEAVQADHLEMALSLVLKLHQKMESYHSEVALLREELERSKNTQQTLRELVHRPVGFRNTRTCPMVQHLETEASDCLSVPFLPVVVKMENFSGWQARQEPWYSAPFYTSTFGYKMCLCVYANGIYNGQGSHLSVFVHLMAGEFDDRLHWPVEEAITVELQNQLSDTHHCSVDCNFTQSSPHSVTRRVSGAVSVARRGSGTTQFISVSELSRHNRGTTQRPKYCQYLSKNCLYFSIY